MLRAAGILRQHTPGKLMMPMRQTEEEIKLNLQSITHDGGYFFFFFINAWKETNISVDGASHHG